MFARTSLSLLSLAVLAVAIPWNDPTTVTVTVTSTASAPASTDPASSCSTGSIQCCQSVQKASHTHILAPPFSVLTTKHGS